MLETPPSRGKDARIALDGDSATDGARMEAFRNDADAWRTSYVICERQKAALEREIRDLKIVVIEWAALAIVASVIAIMLIAQMM